ncbi:MAG: nucleotidyltransferase family protein [Deltaproteobacteria bacterium]|nr:nucleotidyltransferase family protein [Deltaproteobacteria bacterium]
MKTKEEILKTLAALNPELQSRYKVKEIGVFGSLVRGEQTVASDVDLLVDFSEDADLFDLVGLSLFLEEKLRCKVDVVPKRALRPEIRDAVLREVAAI